MSIKSKKEFQNLSSHWDRRNEARIEYEQELRNKIQQKIIGYLEKAKNDFENYFTEENFTIEKNKREISAVDHNLRIQIAFERPNPNVKYELPLAIIENGRNEFQIVIHSFEKIYFPKFSIVREKPDVKEFLKDDLDKMDQEMIFIQDLIDRLYDTKFGYSYYRAENKSPNYDEMIRYESIKQILDKLLKEA